MSVNLLTLNEESHEEFIGINSGAHSVPQPKPQKVRNHELQSSLNSNSLGVESKELTLCTLGSKMRKSSSKLNKYATFYGCRLKRSMMPKVQAYLEQLLKWDILPGQPASDCVRSHWHADCGTPCLALPVLYTVLADFQDRQLCVLVLGVVEGLMPGVLHKPTPHATFP